MRFFDEDNKLFQRTLLTLSVVAALYFLSYFVVRESHTTRDEKDGCPIAGCERVDLPIAAYYVYNPLVHLDRYMEYQTEFEFH